MTQKNINKKATLFLSAVFVCMSVAYAQTTVTEEVQNEQAISNKSQNNGEPHRIFVYYGIGYANNIYDRINNLFIHRNYSLSSAIEAKYAYFFTPKWGISLGAGLSYYVAKGTLNIEGIIPHYADPDFDLDNQGRYYDLHYKANDLTEKQQIWALEVPLQAHFEHFFNHKYGIFASLGAKGYFPVISARSVFSKGELTTAGYESFTNTWYTDAPHFGKQNTGATPAKVSLRWTVDAIADFGGTLRLSPACDLYLGVYGSYGFMDVLPKTASKKDFISPEHNRLFAVNSLLSSNFFNEYNKYVNDNNLAWKTVDEKWKRWQVGLKVGIHIKPCNIDNKPNKGKNLRKAQKDFYDKLPESISNAGKTVIIRDTIHIVHVYNTVPDNYKTDTELNQLEKDNISALIDIFSNSKILFDLDSDIPKIDNINFIAEAAKVLQKESSLSLIIEGYTCDLGTEKHNRELANRRAVAIRNLFIQHGVSPLQIQVAAYISSDFQNNLNIKDKNREEHRAVIFKILKAK